MQVRNNMEAKSRRVGVLSGTSKCICIVFVNGSGLHYFCVNVRLEYLFDPQLTTKPNKTNAG